MKRIVLMFVLLIGTLTQAMAQQTISNEDFEINLPEGWSYDCSDKTGARTHFFKKDSLSYTVVVFPVSIFKGDAFREYLPLGTKYVEAEEELVVLMGDGEEVEYKKIKGDDTNPNVSGCVYVTDRNDKTIIIQEINRTDSLAAEDNLLGQFRWPEIVYVPFHVRVDRFCEVLNGAMKEFAFTKGFSFRHSAKKKKLFIEQHLQNPKDEAEALAKGKLKKKDTVTSELFFNTLPFFLRMGVEDYSFQLSRFLMNGKLESKVVYKPKDYKHLFEREKQYASFTMRLVEDE